MATKQIQATVQQSYDQIAPQYLEWTESRHSPRLRYVDKLISYLASALHNCPVFKVLELGCGAGVPVTAYLTERVGEVVANDISPNQMELARERVLAHSDRAAKVNFIGGDMLDLEFESDSFDGAVAFFSLFHVPVAEQRIMLDRIRKWLTPGGILVCNFGASSDSRPSEGEKRTEDGGWGSFLGAPMFWANLGVEGSLEMIRGAGLEIVEWEVIDAADGKEELSEDDPDAGVRFVWVVARKV